MNKFKTSDKPVVLDGGTPGGFKVITDRTLVGLVEFDFRTVFPDNLYHFGLYGRAINCFDEAGKCIAVMVGVLDNGIEAETFMAAHCRLIGFPDAGCRTANYPFARGRAATQTEIEAAHKGADEIRAERRSK